MSLPCHAGPPSPAAPWWEALFGPWKSCLCLSLWGLNRGLGAGWRWRGEPSRQGREPGAWVSVSHVPFYGRCR